ncbi:MAG: hypothetical protein KKH01_09870 [Firmicutes bacterium]|nr:hypothetical protein [Bacillota bacterium]
MKKFLTVLLLLISVGSLAACQYESDTIVIGEGDWQSNQFYNQVAKYIIEEGYDNKVDVTVVDTPLLIQSLTDGSIQVNVETWSDNMPTYQSDIAAGNYTQIGVNFSDNYQGIYIPQYLADEYDIEYIVDLVDHKELFADPEISNWNAETDKAVVYGGPSGWQVTEFLINKFTNTELYPELAANFELRPLESSALLDATLIDAYESSEPWVGYNWEPTAIMGTLDMVLLKDYFDYDITTGAGNMPTNDVTIVVTSGFQADYPEISEFLSKYATSSQVASDALSYMTENDMTATETAKWWLSENSDMWSLWVTADAKAKILAVLEL